MLYRQKFVLCALTTTLTLSTHAAEKELSQGTTPAANVTHILPNTATVRTHEIAPFGIELLLCMASAKLDGASLSDAYGQCTSR